MLDGFCDGEVADGALVGSTEGTVLEGKAVGAGVQRNFVSL